jgi:hypothetical protein
VFAHGLSYSITLSAVANTPDGASMPSHGLLVD